MHTRWRVTSLVLLALASLVLATACKSPAASNESPPSSAANTPSNALVQLDAQGRGALYSVDLTPRDSDTAFAPERRAIERRWRMVNIGVHDHAHGVRTLLVVPMWYDERTEFVGLPGQDYGRTLDEATEHPDWAWDAAGTTDVSFRLEDEVFYLDEVSIAADNASDPNR